MIHLATANPPRQFIRRAELVGAFQAARDELVSTLYFLLGNHEDAQDAAQEAFVKCWRFRSRLRKVRNLRAWIFRVGLNAAKDLQRNAWRRRARPLANGDAAVLPDGQSPPETLLRREETMRVRAALVGLRQEEKQVFLLRQNGDLTYEDIAAVLHRPVGTVKTQMRAALAKLRQVLREPTSGI